MKILVCGAGSIGERHIGNLLKLGYEDIIVYRNRNLPLRGIDRKFPVFSSLEKALLEKPDIAFICNPTHLHMSTALSCLRAGCHVFVEKPLAESLEGFEDLFSLIHESSPKVMVGYMMRFHPCLQKIHEWIEEGKIGRLVYIRSQWGEYLPGWHPWEDYRQTYAARKEMGGGPGLTLSHELDTLLWFCGEYSDVAALENRGSDLEINTEHGIDILVKFKSGVTGNIHMDYFQSPPCRSLELVGTCGRIFFDYYQSTATLYEPDNEDGALVFDISETFDRNDLFIAEIKYFLDSIQKNIPVSPGIKEGADVLKLLEDAFRKKL